MQISQAVLLKIAVIVEDEGGVENGPSRDKAPVGGADLHGKVTGWGRLELLDIEVDGDQIRIFY